MRRAVLFSFHCYQAPHKAGFPWLADAYREEGWDVTFVTASLSLLSRLRRDRRLRYCRSLPVNRLLRIRPGLATYLLFSSIHPVNLRLRPLNWASAPFMRRYAEVPLGELEPVLRQADLIIFESTACLLLVRRIRELNRDAKLVYRVSDDLRYNGNHPLVLQEEERVAGLFDLVSVPSPFILRRFAHLETARLQYHGIDVSAFTAVSESPYPDDGLADAVFVGMSRIDREFFRLAPLLAEGWRFHVIGPFKGLRPHPRLVLHGLMSFGDTVPYIQHADAGLHTLPYEPGAEAFSDSLKALQYTYCRLPVVAPEFLRSERTNTVYYRPADGESIAAAMGAARAMDRGKIDTGCVRSSRDLARELAEGL